MSKHQCDKKLNEQIAELPKEITPERDLWLGIEKAISSPVTAHKTNFTLLPLAASIVAAVLLTWLSVHQAPNSISADQLVVSMSEEFLQQKKLMLTSFGQPDLTQLPAEIQKQLVQLTNARVAIENALKNDQTNTELLNLLRWTQQQELDLIQQLYSPQWQTI